MDTFNLQNPTVLHFLFAFMTFGLGMLGMFLGNRLVNGKTCLLFGLGIGVGSTILYLGNFGYLVPGWVGVFLFGFLLSRPLAKLACAVNGKDAGTPPPKK